MHFTMLRFLLFHENLHWQLDTSHPTLLHQELCAGEFAIIPPSLALIRPG